MAFITSSIAIPRIKSSAPSSCGLRRSTFTPKLSAVRIHRQSSQAILSPPRMARTERTFIAVKPDGINRGILGAIISRFENKGFKLVAIKTLVPTKQLAEEHYESLKEKPFFNDLVHFITSGPVCAMVWEGEQVVVTARKMIGETNPLSSAPGTIRGDYAVDVGRNVIHGSDAVETAQREIALWFEESELTTWQPTSSVWVYE